MANIKPKPPMCMRCKKKSIITSGSYSQDGKIIAWHYSCQCGWKKRSGRYPKLDFSDIVDVVIPQEWFTTIPTKEERKININKELSV